MKQEFGRWIREQLETLGLQPELTVSIISLILSIYWLRSYKKNKHKYDAQEKFQELSYIIISFGVGVLLMWSYFYSAK